MEKYNSLFIFSFKREKIFKTYNSFYNSNTRFRSANRGNVEANSK